MTDKDYIDHAINSIVFLHKYDESYKITKAAREKEEELFQGSIQFLKNLSLGKSESHIKTFTQTEQDFIDRVKEIKKGEVSNLELSRSDIVITFRSPFINGYVLDAHTWTYPCPSLNLIEEIRKISGEW